MFASGFADSMPEQTDNEEEAESGRWVATRRRVASSR
jgi:hypothetical protein